MYTGHGLENNVRHSSSNQMAETRRHLLSRIVSEFRGVIGFFCAYMAAGTLCFYHSRNHMSGMKTNSILDAFYFTASLVTSTGYGDVTPRNNFTMLLLSLFGLVGTLLFGFMLNLVVEILYIKNQQREDESEESCVGPLFLFGFHMGVGTVVLHFIERMDAAKAFFCITSTITSIDSDGCFITKRGRIFSLFWMVSGTIVLGNMLFAVMEQIVEERRASLPTLVPERRMTRTNFNAADSDDDDDRGDLAQAKYILLKLEEMGKFSQEDIRPIIEEFKNSTLRRRASDP